MRPVKVAIVGCGQISGAYLKQLTRTLSGLVEVTACCDLISERAVKQAAEYGVPKACTTEQAMADQDIEIIVNLTMPAQHYEVIISALEAGKHVFSEKPLTTSRELGQKIMATAKRHGLLLSGAPDTFLGAGLQTCRRLIDEGAIGVPVNAQAFLASGFGSERYYNIFTGPMFDMGPYYLTALVSLLGPVRRVTGSSQIPFSEKPYPEDSPDFGKTFKVERPGNISGVLDFQAGAIGAITTTCEASGHYHHLVIYGSEGTIFANDPNAYTGDVLLQRDQDEPEKVKVPKGFEAWGRGLGVAELAYAIRNKRQPRASGDLMYHVFDIMHRIHDASRDGHHFELDSGCSRPKPFEYSELLAAAPSP